MVKREYPSAIPKSETAFPHFVSMKKQGRWITPKWQPVFYVKADWHTRRGWSKALSKLGGRQHTQRAWLQPALAMAWSSCSVLQAELNQGQKRNFLVVRFTLLALRNALAMLLLQAVTTCAIAVLIFSLWLLSQSILICFSAFLDRNFNIMGNTRTLLKSNPLQLFKGSPFLLSAPQKPSYIYKIDL